jgi:16S rRNA (cytosine967-C5)-methyltransferase
MAQDKGSGQKPRQSLVELRAIAARILAQALQSKDPLEESMTRVLGLESARTFADFDRSWLYEVVSGVLRFRGRIDFIIDTYSLKKKPSGEIRRFLEIAVFQLLGQETPPALVVSETVQAIRQNDGEAPSKFANAILRKVADHQEQWRSWKVTEQTPFDEQVAWCSLPEWLFKKLRKERGSPWVFAFSQAVLERPEVWYRTETETLLLPEGYRGTEPPGFVQDISNQKLVEAVSAHLKAHLREHPGIPAGQAPAILDLCSAPGGKSLGLAYAGFQVTATDSHADRLLRVHENVNRLNLSDRIHVEEYSKVYDSSKKYDLIWIDAPCSSIGIIRRHPEIKWNRTFHDVERMHLAQEQLLRWGKEHLNKNGLIVYSTCSLLQLENDFKIEGLEAQKTWEWVPQNEPRGDGIHAVLYRAKSD